MGRMNIPYIDPMKLNADVDKFSPIVNLAVGLVPGEPGTALSSLLKALESPSLLNAAVTAVNSASGAKPAA